MIVRFLQFCSYAWLLTALTADAQSQSLIVNGSFEEGPTVGSFLNLESGNKAVTGWTVTGEGVDYVAAYWISSDGKRAIDLDGSARSTKTPPHVQGGIAQTFPTTPGTRYRVTFDLAGNPNQLPELKRCLISAGAESTEFTFNARGKTGRNMGWQKMTWSFTATDAATTLEFRSLTVSPQTGYGAAIDNVSVVAEDATVRVSESLNEILVQFESELLFDTGKFDLKPEAAGALRSLAALLSRYPHAPVLIEGHTDSIGSAQSNRILSENRAASVRHWLVANGVSNKRLRTVGHGAAAPVATNDTAEGRQKNRRVEVRVQK